MYECFADDCPFTSATLTDYADHVAEVHPEHGRGFEPVAQVPQETEPMVYGGMRRTRHDYGQGDIW